MSHTRAECNCPCALARCLGFDAPRASAIETGSGCLHPAPNLLYFHSSCSPITMASIQQQAHITVVSGLPGPFDAATAAVETHLKGHGFGVVSTIDMQAKMKEKLGADMRPFKIIGACMPKIAYQILQAEPNVATFMPCNVTVREEADGSVTVTLVNPDMMATMFPKPEVQGPAKQVADGLQSVAAAIAGQPSA
eukprot:m.221751 g.221751  ORF g.221751 m.221751 type:complete len:194 (-) comp10646_c0_seq1:74-655(-)